MFVSLYFFFFFIILYFKNKNRIFEYPETDKISSLSIVIPCYNEEESIEQTAKSILQSDYLGLKKVIIVDDCSKDNSYKIIQALAKKDSRILAVQTPKNTGRAASAKNYGTKFVNTELVGFSDSDSFPEKDAIRKMAGFFNDPKVGAVTCSVLVKHKDKFIEKLQTMEYAVIAWTRKLLGYVDGIWAMPGPLALYRTELIKRIHGFDENSLTEDIEITWHVVSEGYKVEMCLPARVESVAPTKTIYWLKQRIRWDEGGIQCINKYKSHIISKLGYFIIPFFTLSMFLGVLGVGVFFYVFIRNAFSKFLFTGYSIAANTPLLTLNDFYITPSVLNYLGIVMFVLGLFFVVIGLRVMKEGRFKGFRNIFNLLFYMVVYLTLYPLILVIAICKMTIYKIKGKRLGWGTR